MQEITTKLLDLLDEHSLIGAMMYCLSDAQRSALVKKIETILDDHTVKM